jgi:hypothetical protein
VIGTIVRYPSTGTVGEVRAIDNLTALAVGDMAGAWFYVWWTDGACTWVQASSVEVVR